MANAKHTITNEEVIESIKKAATNGRMRRIYSDVAAATAAFDSAKAIAEKHNLPCVAAPAESFGEGMQPTVAVVGSRDRDSKTGKMLTGIKALVMFPIPTAEAFIANASDWIAKIAEKEAAHVAFRGLRNANTAEEVISEAEKMPRTVEDYVATYARSDGLDTEAYDTLWSECRKFLKDKMPTLVPLLPQKGEVLKAIRSASYAAEEYEALESKGVFVPFLTTLLTNAGAAWKDKDGNADPVDTSEIESWVETRDEVHIRKAAEQEKDFSVLDNLDLGLAE